MFNMKLKIESTEDGYLITYKSLPPFCNRILVRNFERFSDALTFVNQYMFNYFNN